MHYKVLVQKNKKLYSSVAAHKSQLYNTNARNTVLRYKVKDWTYPKIKGSKLFVFTTLEAAKQFIEEAKYACDICRKYSFVIYECIATNANEACSYAFFAGNLIEFWKSPYDGFEKNNTAWCDRVFLTRRINGGKQ